MADVELFPFIDNSLFLVLRLLTRRAVVVVVVGDNLEEGVNLAGGEGGRLCQWL